MEASEGDIAVLQQHHVCESPDAAKGSVSLLDSSEESASPQAKALVCSELSSPSSDAVHRKVEGCEMRVGDLVWVKQTSFPWWPAMLTLDPVSDKHCRTIRFTEYHVQVH